MSDDKDDLDGSDWLSSQFTPTEQVPKQASRTPVAPPQNAEPVFGTAPVRQVPPVPAPPAQNAAGGFNWGLRPGGHADAAPAVPTAPPPVAAVPAATPPPLVVPPTAASSTPTVPYVPSAPTPASEPTQPLSWSEFAATQAPEAPPSTPLDQPTQAFTVPAWQPTHTASTAHDDYVDHSAAPTSAIDSLFGDHQFQEYEEVGVLKAVQTPPVAGSRSAARPPRAPLATSQKALMGVACGLIAVLLLIALFFIGEHLGAASAAAQITSSTTGSKSTPTPAGNGGPAAPGVQQWSALQGGECIQPFSSAWAVTFTVVACTDNHDAQMVFKGRLSDTDDTGYPSASDFQTQLTALCSAPTAINYKAAASVTDLQVSFSYPPTSASWIGGDRTYYCFVDRVSGDSLPGDLSVPSSGN